MKRLFAFVHGPNYIIDARGFSEPPHKTAILILNTQRLSLILGHDRELLTIESVILYRANPGKRSVKSLLDSVIAMVRQGLHQGG